MKKLLFYLIILSSILLSGIDSAAAGSLFAPKIDSIQLIFDDHQLVLPGESFRIGIASYQKNGKIRNTTGMLGGSVWWLRYKVEVSGGTDFSGRISVNEELIPSKGNFTDDAMPFRYMITARSKGGSGGLHGSGGSGGSGGRGGNGNPNGNAGSHGQSGPSAMGWADSGRSGQIRILKGNYQPALF